VGAVKAGAPPWTRALRVAESEAPARSVPSEALLDRFVAAYNAADVDGLLDLMLETHRRHARCAFQTGPDAMKGERSWFGRARGHPEWPAEFRFDSQRAERATFCGEPIVLVFRTRRGRKRSSPSFASRRRRAWSR